VDADPVEKNAPALVPAYAGMPQVRMLREAVLPRWNVDAAEVLARLRYDQRRNAVAAAAHRKRIEAWIVDIDRILTIDEPEHVRACGVTPDVLY
jgi:hypothetical protein